MKSIRFICREINGFPLAVLDKPAVETFTTFDGDSEGLTTMCRWLDNDPAPQNQYCERSFVGVEYLP